MPTTLSTLTARIKTISSEIEKRYGSRLIDCSGAQKDLLALLSASMTEDERNMTYVANSEELAEEDIFDAFMCDMVARTEQKFNVRFI